MRLLLAISHTIDEVNNRIGRIAAWLIVAAIAISGGNALARKALDLSSNALLEMQWYLFSGVFLLCAGYALLSDAHIRVDVLSSRLSRRAQAWIDILGTLLFLFPMVALVLYEAGPWFLRAWQSGEVSSSAGGLVLWPAKILVPVGFSLLGLQGISELIKNVAFLRRQITDPRDATSGKTAERELATEILERQSNPR